MLPSKLNDCTSPPSGPKRARRRRRGRGRHRSRARHRLWVGRTTMVPVLVLEGSQRPQGKHVPIARVGNCARTVEDARAPLLRPVAAGRLARHEEVDSAPHGALVSATRVNEREQRPGRVDDGRRDRAVALRQARKVRLAPAAVLLLLRQQELAAPREGGRIHASRVATLRKRAHAEPRAVGEAYCPSVEERAKLAPVPQEDCKRVRRKWGASGTRGVLIAYLRAVEAAVLTLLLAHVLDAAPDRARDLGRAVAREPSLERDEALER